MVKNPSEENMVPMVLWSKKNDMVKKYNDMVKKGS